MNFVMSLPIFCLRSVQMCKLSHSFNQCLEKLYPIALPTLMNTPDWTYLLKGFGIVPMSKLFLTLECSILWPKAILTNLYLAATARMKMRRREHMRNASKMSNMAHLHHSVAGGMGQITSTFYKRLASMLSANLRLRIKLFIGFIAV